MIRECCICGGKARTVYQMPFYDLLGSGSRKYVQNIAVCPVCGYIFTQNPFTEEQLEHRYKKLSKFEYDALSYDYAVNDTYQSQCMRQKNFIDESVGGGGGGGMGTAVFLRSGLPLDIICIYIKNAGKK